MRWTASNHVLLQSFLAKVQAIKRRIDGHRIQRQPLSLASGPPAGATTKCVLSPPHRHNPTPPCLLGPPLIIVAPHRRQIRMDQRHTSNEMHYRPRPQRPPAPRAYVRDSNISTRARNHHPRTPSTPTTTTTSTTPTY